ncbi:MAG: hypothetical protein ACRDSJ_02655 [Rubrobacteraceae bacterium]
MIRMNDVRWPAVAVGWLAAVVASIVIALVLGALFGVSDPETGAGATVGGLFIALITGFLAYGIGGYVAARRAGVNGPLNGMMTAVLGIVIGIALAIILAVLGVVAGLVFSGGQLSGLQNISFGEGLGLAGGGLLAFLSVVIVNVLGGYVGGKISGPDEGPAASRPSRVR